MISESLSQLQAERARLRAVIDQFPAAAAVYEGPDHVVVAASQAYRRIVGGRDLVGRPLAEAVPELAEQGFVALLNRAYATGQAVGGSAVRAEWDSDGDGQPESFLVDFTYQPVTDPDGGVWGIVVHVVDVTARHEAESALRASEARFRAVFDAGAVGIALLDAEGRPVEANPALCRMLGRSAQELRAMSLAELTHPGDVDAARDHYRELMAGRIASYAAERRWLRADGSTFWAHAVVSLVRDAEERPLYAVAMMEDVSERRQAEQLLEEQAAELESQVEEARALTEQLEAANGELVAARRQAEREQRRDAFLADAGHRLAGSLDYTATLREVVQAAVPGLADWCALDMVADPASDAWPPRVERLAVAHPDPARVAWAHELQRRYAPHWDAPAGMPQVLRTGQPEWAPEITDEMLVAAARDEEELSILRAVGFTSYVCVPLRARGLTLGALTLVMAESGRRYGPEDVALALELARRAAAAVDNARLYAAERQARAAAERAVERVARLQLVTAALGQALTEHDVAAVVLEEGIASLDADTAAVYRLTPDGATLELLRQSGMPEEGMAAFARVPLDAPVPLAEVARTGRPLLASRAEVASRYPHLHGAGSRFSEEAWITLPLAAHGGPLGALAFGFSAARAFHEEDRAFAMALAQQCSQAMERARLFDAERAARAEAEAADRAKTEFLSAMSHELRTPLNAIAGYVDLLDAGVRGPLTEIQRSDLGRIRRAEEVLLGLINDVLNFARLDAGGMEYRREPVGVPELVAEMAELIRPQLRARELAYASGAPPGLRVLGDRERIRQILLNLLTNAVKFTERGGRVEVAAAAAGDRVQIRVADTGRGIPPDKLQTVFDPFVQLDRHRTDESQQGVGLGLAISRELARGMGGDLSAESTPGQGSTFTLTLPRVAEPG